MEWILHNFKYYNERDELVEHHGFRIEDGRIREIVEGNQFRGIKAIGLDGDLISPGFIDLQVNGGRSVFFTHAIEEYVLRQMDRDHFLAGTTAMLPTLVSTSKANILKAIGVVKVCMQDPDTGIRGLHLEGPFINPEKKGAHNAKYLRQPTNEELEELLEAGRGVIKLMTIAPELFTPYQIDLIKSYGVILFAGHSNLRYSEAIERFEQGVTGVTHLYNAMSPLNSREPGLVGAALNSNTYAGIVVDGFHCDYAAVSIAHKLKQDKLFLVSDASFTGDTNLEFDGIVFIHRPGQNDRPGHYVNAEGQLAGSNITLLDAVRNAVKFAGIPLPMALKMASGIPASVIGIDRNMGSLCVGSVLNLVRLCPETLSLKGVMRNGMPPL